MSEEMCNQDTLLWLILFFNYIQKHDFSFMYYLQYVK